jgi:dephospho-CoA kinase
MPTRRVALTGGIATGKSDVLARFAALGVPTVDADVLARDAVRPGTPGLAAVVARFGAGVLAADGTLDRARLGTIVFADARARRDLEAIVHPAVRAEMDRWFSRLPPHHAVAVADVPLLYETGRDAEFDAVIVAICPTDLQLARLVARNGLSPDEAQRRIAEQWPTADKAARATHVIWTDGTFERTDAQVRAVLDALAPPG